MKSGEAMNGSVVLHSQMLANANKMVPEIGNQDNAKTR